MAGTGDSAAAEIARLEKRLERERKARLAAEALAEISLRELYEKRRELELLQTITATANEAATLKEAMQIALDQICAHTGWPIGHVLFPTGDSTVELVSAAIWHIENPERFQAFRKATEAQRFAIGEGLPGRVLADARPAWIVDVVLDPNFPRSKAAQEVGIQSGFAFPMRVETEIVAVLEFFATEAMEPNESLLEVMGHIGTQLGRVIERKRSQEHIQQQLERLDALRAIDMAITASLDLRLTLGVFLEQITTLLHVDAADILLCNMHAQTLEYAAGKGFRTGILRHAHQRLGRGHAGQAALQRRILHIADIRYTPEAFSHAPLLSEEGFIAYYAVPLLAKGYVKGVLEVFHRAPLKPDQDFLDFLDALAGQAAIAIDNATMFEDMQRSNIELTMAYDATIEGWSKALELRDKETEGHTQRVTEMTLQMARAIGIGEDELVHVRRGAMLHDIGKMGIPDAILHKPGKLTDDEWEIMRLHTVYAYEMLLPIAFLRPAIDIPYCHHEKWDGAGYPRGLKGEEIPLSARIFAIADVWDALRSDRPYKKAWPEDKAIEQIHTGTGGHFDPKCVEVFLQTISTGRVFRYGFFAKAA